MSKWPVFSHYTFYTRSMWYSSCASRSFYANPQEHIPRWNACVWRVFQPCSIWC